jgi:xanthine/uracil permease
MMKLPRTATESLPRLLCYGLQHVLVMYPGTVAVPLILPSALLGLIGGTTLAAKPED